MSKYWLALAAGAVGVALLMRRKKKAAAVSGCGCMGSTDPHSGLPDNLDGYGDIDALPQQQQVFVDPLQRYERVGTR